MSKTSEVAVTGLDPNAVFKPIRRAGVPMTDAAAEYLLEQLRCGRTLWAIVRDNERLPDQKTINAYRKANPDYDAAFVEARSEGLSMRVEEALEYQGSVRGDKALSVAAAKYLDGAVKVAEKLAPKSFGPLVRHAGHDGNELTVKVVEYAKPKPVIDAKAVELAALDKPSDK
jgi:hypothetical protein